MSTPGKGRAASAQRYEPEPPAAGVWHGIPERLSALRQSLPRSDRYVNASLWILAVCCFALAAVVWWQLLHL